MSGDGWNPRYVHFARVHGRTPDEQLAHDRAKPTAVMLGFMLWIGGCWTAWRALHASRVRDPESPIDDHAAFDRGLSELAACAGCTACTPKERS